MSELNTLLAELSKESAAISNAIANLDGDVLAVESVSKEIKMMTGFLNGLEHSFEAFIGNKTAPTRQDLQNYEVSVESMLALTGMDLAQGVYSTSFEAEEAKEEVGEKKENIAKRVWAGIVAMFKKLVDFVKNIIGKIRNSGKVKALEAKTKELTEKLARKEEAEKAEKVEVKVKAVKGTKPGKLSEVLSGFKAKLTGILSKKEKVQNIEFEEVVIEVSADELNTMANFNENLGSIYSKVSANVDSSYKEAVEALEEVNKAKEESKASDYRKQAADLSAKIAEEVAEAKAVNDILDQALGNTDILARSL